MFGHGQIEGFEEKYGMEYRRSYRDEKPDGYLVDRHERDIFPLMKRRALFSGSAEFRLYDLFSGGSVNENVFAYSNRLGDDRALVFYNNSYYESSGWIKRSDPAIPGEDGSSRRDTLSEALSIHGDGCCFTLLREQRSGLWFVRSSKAVSENGFFVSLKGYEAQVFLDIHEVEDDPRGRWARLHNDLNGRGIPDLEAGIQDIFLGGLYYRFTELFKPEFISALHEFFLEEGAAKTAASGGQDEPDARAESLAASLEAPAKAFIEAAGSFIDGAGGQYDPWTPKDEKGVNLQYKKVNNEEILEEFNAFLGRFAAVSKYAGGAAALPAGSFLKVLALRIRERPALCAFALGCCLLSLLRRLIGEGARGSDAAALAFDHWRLDRKLRERLCFFGMGEDEARRLCALTRAALARTAPGEVSPLLTALPFRAGEFAGALIQEYYHHDDFRQLLGINVFDDVTWFSKEGFEDILFYGAFFLALENSAAFEAALPAAGTGSPAGADAAGAADSTGAASGEVSPGKAPPWPRRIARIAELYDVLAKAGETSGFRFDTFMDSLTGAEPAVKAETAGVKSPAKAVGRGGEKSPAGKKAKGKKKR
jgi:hypothetical protein